ncbi:MAG: VTT domain-containing protein [Candidatus Gracilibacteria bacterium]
MFIIDFILHIDTHLIALTAQYGAYIYGILFTIVFLETGVVFFPFLPGDSLLFAAGAFSAQGVLDPWLLTGLFLAAAILGDALNFWIGSVVGKKMQAKGWIPESAVAKTKGFFHKYGAKTIVLARFLPVVRTFAPFVAGMGHMEKKVFFFYNIIGGSAWVLIFMSLGYFLGAMPIVKENFEIAILFIIFVSVVPTAIEIYSHHRKNRKISKA